MSRNERERVIMRRNEAVIAPAHYIHEYRLVQRSRFVPKADCQTPVPKWKRAEWSHDVLPEGDPATDPDAEVIR